MVTFDLVDGVWVTELPCALSMATALRQSLIELSAARKAAEALSRSRSSATNILEAGNGRIKPSTLLVDRSRIERHVKPLLGTRAVASLKPADMERFMRDVMAGKTAPKRSEMPKGGKRALAVCRTEVRV